MVDFKKLGERAKELVDKRGGTDALKDDAAELKEIATGSGSLADKAKAAAEALKDPGAEAGPEPTAEPRATATEPGEPAGERRARRAERRKARAERREGDGGPA